MSHESSQNLWTNFISSSLFILGIHKPLQKPASKRTKYLKLSGKWQLLMDTNLDKTQLTHLLQEELELKMKRNWEWRREIKSLDNQVNFQGIILGATLGEHLGNLFRSTSYRI